MRGVVFRKGDITELRPAKRNLGEEEGTSEGNLVALACSRNSNVASRPVLQRRPGHLRPPHPAEPRRSGRGAGDRARPGGFGGWSSTRVQATPRPCREGKHSAESSASREAAPTRRPPPRSEASRRTPQFPLRKWKRPCFPGRPALTNRPETANVYPGCRPISGSRPGIPGLRAGKERFFV